MDDPVVRRFGDHAFLIELGTVGAAHAVAAALEEHLDMATGGRPGDAGPAVVGVVVGFGTVVVLLDQPDRAADGVVDRIQGLVRRAVDAATRAPGTPMAGTRAPVQIPVVFDGPDLAEVAAAIGADESRVVELLAGQDLDVAFVGFAPGFPYLTGLPPALAALPRRPSPRPEVPAGSVALAGGFASVYPRASPGGWNLVGTTTTPMFDADRPPYALVRPGDRVRFVQAPPDAADRPRATGREGTARPPLRAPGTRWAEIVEPGLLSLIQDAGRRRVAAVGVPGAGAADPEALLLANRLVGNPDGAAGLEVTASGPSMRFAVDAHVAVVGSGAVDVSLDGRPCLAAALLPVGAGQTLAIGRVRDGLRAYLAVAGGLETPVVMGSRSSDLLSGLGPGALVAGDQLGLGAPVRPRGALASGTVGPRPAHDEGRAPNEGRAGNEGQPGDRVLRVVAGPLGDRPSWARLVAGWWMVGQSSNRIGVRLEPADDRTARAGDGWPTAAVSTGMVTGAIQLPPDGRPILLLPDHATVGGYPVVGCVIAADLPGAGQLAPGHRVRFTEVDQDGARTAWEERARWLEDRVEGWYPTAAGT